MATSKHTL